jgi:hypothetical protein
MTSEIIFVCSVALVGAIAYLIWGRVASSSGWTSDGLHSGDLYALIDVASGLRPNGLTDDQALRLNMRGFVREMDNGQFRATLKGRLALRLRRSARRRAARVEAKSQQSGERTNT